jgi:hypothetical protein
MALLIEKTSPRRRSQWLRLLLRLIPASASYRPELHYMRGPGPKYRERHQHPFDRALPGKAK